MINLKPIAGVAIICVAFTSCKKETASPQAARDAATLKTNDLNTLPKVRWIKNVQVFNTNVNVSNDTISVTGDYSGTKDFDPGNGVFNLTRATEGPATVMFKRDGNFVSASNQFSDFGNFAEWEGTGLYEGKRLKDKAGNVVTMRYFVGVKDMDPGPEYYPLSANYDAENTAVSASIYIKKLNARGEFLWAKLNGGERVYGESSASMAIDDTGNIYISSMGPGAITHSGPPYPVSFIQKADGTGKLLWETKLTNWNPSDIVVDNAGNSYVTTAEKLILRLDKNGKIAGKITIKAKQGMSDLEITHLAIDKKNNLYVAGRHLLKFPNGKSTWHAFIQKMDTNGNFGWYISTSSAQPPNNFTDNFIVYRLTVDDVGDIYMTCGYFGNIKIGPNTVSSPSKYTTSLVRLSQPGY